MNLEIDHIGYAVKKLDRAIRSFEELGFSFDSVIEDLDRNVNIVFGVKDGYRIELVCPLDKTKPSPVDGYISAVGPTPYHICYQCDDLKENIDELTKNGFRVIIEPRPAVAFNGKSVVFLMNLGLGLMEIVQK